MSIIKLNSTNLEKVVKFLEQEGIEFEVRMDEDEIHEKNKELNCIEIPSFCKELPFFIEVLEDFSEESSKELPF